MSDKPGELLVQRIVALLHDKGLRGGDRIPGEKELCAELGVSRPAIRESLVALETVGMLVSRKGSGRVIQSMDFGVALARVAGFVAIENQRLLDLLYIRQVLEVNVLPEGAPKLSATAMARLGEVTRTIEAKAARGEYFASDDREFHLLLHSGLGNEVLNGLLQLFWATFERIDPSLMSHSQRLEETAAHHRRIYDALEQGDIRKAQHHLDTHFYDTAFVIAHQPGRDDET